MLLRSGRDWGVLAGVVATLCCALLAISTTRGDAELPLSIATPTVLAAYNPVSEKQKGLDWDSAEKVLLKALVHREEDENEMATSAGPATARADRDTARALKRKQSEALALKLAEKAFPEDETLRVVNTADVILHVMASKDVEIDWLQQQLARQHDLRKSGKTGAKAASVPRSAKHTAAVAEAAKGPARNIINNIINKDRINGAQSSTRTKSKVRNIIDKDEANKYSQLRAGAGAGAGAGGSAGAGERGSHGADSTAGGRAGERGGAGAGAGAGGECVLCV